MRKLLAILLFFSCFELFASNEGERDSLNIYKKIDTTYIESFSDLLNVKLLGVVRSNKFSVKDNITQQFLEYSINTNLNLGLGFNFKGIGVEFQYNPKGINNDDYKYGKSKQFSIATTANGRRFIYDVHYRYNQGYHTTSTYKIPNDTGNTLQHIYRPDIENTIIGAEFIYIFNNKRFSIAAPYNFLKKQKKSAGSLLLGTFASLYTINANSLIFPDSLRDYFKPEVQFKNAGSITYGFSCGYTYTFVFSKNWFVNIYTLPGLAIQKYYSINANNESVESKLAIGGFLQSRFSLGYNRKKNFIAIIFMNNNYLIDNDKKSSLNYKYGAFKFYYGHRFGIIKR